MAFSKTLLQLRKDNHMSQEELAVKLGVSRQAISRWEMGNVYPDSFNLLKIAKLFCVTTDYLLNNNEEDVAGKELLVNERNDIEKEADSIKRDMNQKKMNSIVKYVNLGEFLILSILCAVVKGNAELFIVEGAIVFFTFMMSFIFRYVLKTGAYDFISGVDTKKYKYDEKLLAQLLLNVEFAFIFNALIIGNIIMFMGLINTLSNKQGDIFVAICVAIYTIATVVVVLKLSTRIKPIEE